MGLRQKVSKNLVSGNSGKTLQHLPKILGWFDLVGNISFDALAIHERGEILYANQEFLDMFGYTLQEIRKTSAFDMLAPQSREAAKEKITAGYEGAYEAYGRKKDGTTFPILIRAKEAFFKNRQVRVVALRDLTLQQQQLEQLKAVFESSQDCILVWDQDYNYLYANQAAIDHVNTTRDKVIGKNMRDGLGHIPDFMHLWMSRVDEVFTTGKPMRVEDAVPVDDRLVYSESVLSPIRYPGGDMFAVSVVYRDVTGLRTSQEHYKRLSEAAFEGICIHDKGRIVDANPQFEHMFGFPSGESKGADCYELIAPQSIDMVKGYIKSGFEGPYQSIALKKDGSEFPIEVRARQVEVDGKRLRMAIFSDMTEQKKLQQELVESEEKYRELYRNARACLSRTRISDGMLLDCSRATAAMFGYGNEEEYINNFSVTNSYVDPSQRERLIEV